MDGAVNPAVIGTSIALGTSLLAGLFSVFVAMRSREGAAVNRDTSVSILFGIAFSLVVLNVIAAALIAVWGMAYVGLLKAALLLTAAFAVAGMIMGLMRGLRSGSARKTLQAP
jgi:hypothetical protein